MTTRVDKEGVPCLVQEVEVTPMMEVRAYLFDGRVAVALGASGQSARIDET